MPHGVFFGTTQHMSRLELVNVIREVTPVDIQALVSRQRRHPSILAGMETIQWHVCTVYMTLYYCNTIPSCTCRCQI